MPRGKRDKPWPCCGSQSHRHLKTCPEGSGATGKIERRPRAAARRTRVRTGDYLDVTAVDVDYLVATIEACKGELARRKDQVEGQLQAIRDAIGGTT